MERLTASLTNQDCIKNMYENLPASPEGSDLNKKHILSAEDIQPGCGEGPEDSGEVRHKEITTDGDYPVVTSMLQSQAQTLSDRNDEEARHISKEDEANADGMVTDNSHRVETVAVDGERLHTYDLDELEGSPHVQNEWLGNRKELENTRGVCVVGQSEDYRAKAAEDTKLKTGEQIPSGIFQPWNIPLSQPPPLLTAETITALNAQASDSLDDRSQFDGDTDSAIGDMSYVSSMTSVTSSIYESVIENGRTYHSYKPGKYMLPNDVTEQGRLDTQHYMLCEAIGGKLFCAPLEPHRINRALDIATGTGIWAMEFADDFPNAEVIGTDLTPIQPRWCPPNCHFEVDDAEDDWVFSQPFSYIHGRALVSCFEDPKDVIFKCVANLEPGGWLEFQDAIIPFDYDGPDAPSPVVAFDDKEPQSVMQKWEKLTIEASIKGGRPWTNVQYYKKWFEEAGLLDVVEQRTKLPLGTWEGLSKAEKRMGVMHFSNIYHGLEGMTLRNLARLDWTFDQSKALVEEVRKELLSRKYRPYHWTVVVMGRKPGP